MSESADLAPFPDRVDYPYYVVTVRSPDAEMSGCLAGFVTQCSIDPPNFLVCISKVNHTLAVAQHSSGMGPPRVAVPPSAVGRAGDLHSPEASRLLRRGHQLDQPLHGFDDPLLHAVGDVHVTGFE